MHARIFERKLSTNKVDNFTSTTTNHVTKRHMGGVQSSDPELSTNCEPAEGIDPLKITDFRRTVKLFNALMDSDAEGNAELLAET